MTLINAPFIIIIIVSYYTYVINAWHVLRSSIEPRVSKTMLKCTTYFRSRHSEPFEGYQIVDHNKGLQTHCNEIDHVKNIDILQDGLKMRRFPKTDLVVSEYGIGTMMFGDQVGKADAISILDTATETLGLNLIDTAEAFPAPFAEDTVGESERIVGEWLRSKGSSFRKNVVLSTKICGNSPSTTWMSRPDPSKGTMLTKEQITFAVDEQLKRLGTDYIDILHFHWPARYVQMYGEPTFNYPSETPEQGVIECYQEQLETIQELQKNGKIRYFGLSNETPYGIGIFTALSKVLKLPAPISLQCSYNLLDRYYYERCLAESCAFSNGNLGLIACSPLAGGALTGKYLVDWDKVPDDARLKQFIGYMYRYITPNVKRVISEYKVISDGWDMPLHLLALAFVKSRPFVTSTLLGVRNKEQLLENIMSLNIPLVEVLQEALDNVHRQSKDMATDVFVFDDPNDGNTDDDDDSNDNDNDNNNDNNDNGDDNRPDVPIMTDFERTEYADRSYVDMIDYREKSQIVDWI